jgi:hypothetical protein
MRAEACRCSSLCTTKSRTAILSASLVTLLAVVPAPAAIAAPASGGGVASSPAAVTLPLGELEKQLSQNEADSLLSSLPIGNLSVSQLVQNLAGLPEFATLASEVGGLTSFKDTLTTAIDGLAPNTTLGELLEPGTLTPTLQTAINGLLGGTLGTLLGGKVNTSVTEALGSVDEGAVLAPLLQSASDPAKLVEELLSKLGPSTLEGALGSTLTGAPVSLTTVGGLANTLGTDPETLATDLGSSSEELPATAMALTAPLTKGKVLGVVPDLAGLGMTVLDPNTPGGEGSGGGTGGAGGGAGGSGGGTGGSGGAGGTGGNGGGSAGAGGQNPGGSNESNGQSSGTPGGLSTIVVNLPGSGTPAAPATSHGAAEVAGKVRVLSHQVKGGTATIIVQVPTAGKVTVSGKHVRSSSRLAARSELLTLKVTLAKATTASLHKHHKHLSVKLKAAFRPFSGTDSSATVTASFS